MKKITCFLGVVFLFCVEVVFASNAGEVSPKLPAIPQNEFSITNFGAKSNDVLDNTEFIQKAIDKAIAEGGGHVIVPKGVYLCGPLNFGNNIDLHLEEGAVLKFLPIDRYPGGLKEGRSFISGTKIHDISITGKGVIDGQGSAWWPYAKDKDAMRPRMIVFSKCDKILIQGVTLQNSPKFHIAIHSDNVTVDGVTVSAPSSTDPVNPSHNTDACDVSGQHILVMNCDISVGDDDFTCGGNTSDVLIKNNKYGYGHGLSIGSPTKGGVSNFIVENCTFENTDYGIRIKTDRDRGGVVENLIYRNLTMKNVGMPILIYEAYNAKDKQYRNLQKLTGDIATNYPESPVVETTPKYKNIMFQNITATVQKGKRAGLIWGLPESKIENVIFENVKIKADNAFGVYWAAGVQFVNCDIDTKDGKNKFDVEKADVTTDGKTTN